MIPLKVIMVDDDPGILDFLTKILGEIKSAKIVGKAENGNDAIKLTKAQRPDLAFLDIGLPDMNGIELAKRLREIKSNVIIVFITAYKDYHDDAFTVYATDYISKPIDEKRVKSTFEHIVQTVYFPKTPDLIIITQGDNNVHIKTDEILCIEKIEKRYVMIYCINESFKTNQTLQELEEQLGANFYRCHKSYIVNIKHIARVVNQPGTSYYEIELKDSNFKGKVLISRERVFELKKFAEYVIKGVDK